MDVWTAVALVALALVVGTYGSIIGAGGGFLILAGLTLFFDLGGATAAGTTVVTTLFIQLTGAYNYDRKGLVDRATAQWFAMGSVPIAFASGAFLSDRIPERSFNLIIGLLLIALAVFTVAVQVPRSDDDAIALPNRAALTGAGSMIGVLSGGFGVGAGLVTVPLLRWVQRLSAHRAAATTTAIGAMSGIAATAGHALANNPKWSYIPFLIGGAVVGGRLGSSNAGRLSSRTVLALLAGGLLIAGVPLVVRSL